MQPREKFLLIVIASVAGLAGVYYGADWLLLAPIRAADKKVANLLSEERKFDRTIGTRSELVARWKKYASQTISDKSTEVSNLFGQDLKQIGKRHGFGSASYMPITGTRIGTGTDVTTVAYRITGEGHRAEALAFLRELYHTPYLTQITRLAVSPVMQKNKTRDTIKLEMSIETPLLPAIDRKKAKELRLDAVTFLQRTPGATPAPARDTLRTEDYFASLAKRNIFLAYVPPPTNAVMVDNQDYKTVTCTVAFIWDQQPGKADLKTIPSKSQMSFTGQGDAAEITGYYVDGKKFGPQRLDLTGNAGNKGWTYTIPMHSPPPPATAVDLAVDNQDKNPIDLEITVTGKDGKPKTKPTIRVKGATRSDLEQYEVASLTVSATYGSGKKVPPQTFQPGKTKQTYIVPPEPMEAPPPIAAGPVNDPPADPKYTVSALLTYEGTHEMIANGATAADRKIIRAGEEGAVDGGKLLAVHPMGGVVQMPTGNFYIYPLGKRFSERVKLEASKTDQLAAAIDAWARQ